MRKLVRHLAMAALLAPLGALALPSAPSIVAGSAAFTETPSALVIDAVGADISWQSFRIDSLESVSIFGVGRGVMNIVGGAAIEIHGRLTSEAPLTLRAGSIRIAAGGLVEAPRLELIATDEVFVDGIVRGSGTLEIDAPRIVIDGPVISDGVTLSSRGTVGSGHLSLGSSQGSFQASIFTLVSYVPEISLPPVIVGGFIPSVTSPAQSDSELLSLAAVPEPGEWLMLSLGLVMVAGFGRRPLAPS